LSYVSLWVQTFPLNENDSVMQGFFPHAITGSVTRLTGRVALVEQELFTFPEHLSSPPVFSGGRITRSLVLCVCFVDRCLSFCPFSFDHCLVCPSSIYGFLLSFRLFSTKYKPSHI